MPRVSRLPAGLSEALWLFLVLRVALSAFALFVWAAASVPGPCHFELAQDHWRTIPPLSDRGIGFPLVGVWQRWDACWYSKIASLGYEPGENASAFFPLYPSLIRIATFPLGGNVALGGLIVSAIAYLAAMTGLYRLVRQDFSRPVARRTVLYASVFPSAFFFFAPFTESLFLALAVWTIYFARQRTWDAVALLGIMAGLTRIQGLLLVAPIAWQALGAWRDTFRGWRDVRRGTPAAGSPPALVRGLLAPSLAAIAPALGFLAFLAFATDVVGQSPLDAQDLWGGRNLSTPWDLVAAAWQWILDKGSAVEAVNLLALVLFVALAVLGLRVLPGVYSAYGVPQLALLTTRILPTPLTSTTRYLLVIFPAFVVLALIGRRRRLDMAWLVISALFLGALLYTFVRGDFVA